MKHKDLAAAYGLSIETVRRWPADKRLQAIADIKAGINPHITEAIAKLSAACYKAQARTGKGVKFDLWQANCAFEVFLFEPGMKMLVERSDLNCINLAGALAIVEAL